MRKEKRRKAQLRESDARSTAEAQCVGWSDANSPHHHCVALVRPSAVHPGHCGPGLRLHLLQVFAHTAGQVGSIAPVARLGRTLVMEEKALVQGHPASKADLHPDSLAPNPRSLYPRLLFCTPPEDDRKIPENIQIPA